MDDIVAAAWREMLADRLGLSFNEYSPLLNSAIERFCDHEGVLSYEVIHTLEEAELDEPLWQALRDEVVVSSSRFFRDKEIFATVEQWLQQYKIEDRLTVLSYGAADGREAYSLAMLLDSANIDYRIIGVDLSRKVLEQAKQALYFERDIQEIPFEYREKYTQSSGQNRYRIIPSLCSRVTFIEPWELHLHVPLTTDLICCQNTFMYLTELKQKTLLQWFERHLAPGGLLLLSPTDLPKWRSKTLQRYDNQQVRAFSKLVEAEV